MSEGGQTRGGVEKSALAVRRLAVLGMLMAASLAHAASSDALFAARLASHEDKPYALETLRGKPLIVNFWARWCAPCRVEIPELAKTQDVYGRRGLTVVGIGLEDKAESVRDFMKAYDMTYTVLLAKNAGIELMQALGNAKAGVPFTIALNRKGEIVASKLGPMTRKDLDSAAEAALK